MTKENDPYSDLHRLLKGYDVNAKWLCAVLGVSHPTALRRLHHPETLTVEELQTISRKCGIPIDRIREVIPA